MRLEEVRATALGVVLGAATLEVVAMGYQARDHPKLEEIKHAPHRDLAILATVDRILHETTLCRLTTALPSLRGLVASLLDPRRLGAATLDSLTKRKQIFGLLESASSVKRPGTWLEAVRKSPTRARIARVTLRVFQPLESM